MIRGERLVIASSQWPLLGCCLHRTPPLTLGYSVGGAGVASRVLASHRRGSGESMWLWWGARHSVAACSPYLHFHSDIQHKFSLQGAQNHHQDTLFLIPHLYHCPRGPDRDQPDPPPVCFGLRMALFLTCFLRAASSALARFFSSAACAFSATFLTLSSS